MRYLQNIYRMANNKTRTKKKATKLKKQISENRFNEEKIWLNVVIEYVIDLLNIYIYPMKGLFLLLLFPLHLLYMYLFM